MPDPATRLRQLRMKRGFETPSEAARAFGWNEHTYKSHENGIRGIRRDAAQRYALAFGSTAPFILFGNGGGASQSVNPIAAVALVGRVSAGAFRYDEGLDSGAFDVPAVPRKDIPAASQYALLVDGPSVNKRIPDGAYAICALFDAYPGGAQHGQLVHVVRERAGLHEHTIKELRYTSKGTLLMPVSDDPRHQEPVELAFGDDGETVRIQGVVIGTFQPM